MISASRVVAVMGACALATGGLLGCPDSHGVDRDAGVACEAQSSVDVSSVVAGVPGTARLAELEDEQLLTMCEWTARTFGAEEPTCVNGTTPNLTVDDCHYNSTEFRDVDCELTLADYVEFTQASARRCLEGVATVDRAYWLCVTERNRTGCGDMP